ncbi:MAG: OsmC family protein [Candidatus Thiosymbion ectosymbiont of Robbea hypermnestra]|nr:OsmC family protein [Candidatus Thiosymbion ectosymbiont of Robbea hypermnestra]
MSEEGRFTIHLEQQEDYEINVRFDWEQAADLLMDEAPPLGRAAGPNASRLLAAAAANCMSASLLYCLAKNDPPADSLRAQATCTLVRTADKRLRVGGLKVRLIVDDKLVSAERFNRCKDLFEDFCIVSASIRQGIPIEVSVEDEKGRLLHQSD